MTDLPRWTGCPDIQMPHPVYRGVRYEHLQKSHKLPSSGKHAFFHFLHGTIEMRKCGVRSVALGTSSFPPPSSYFAPATIRPCGFLPLLSPRPRPRPLTALSPVSLPWMVLTQPETAGRRPTYPPAMPFPVLQCCQACRMRACGPAPLLLVGQIFMTRIE